MVPAAIRKRIFAFGIDVFIVYVLRFFYVNLAIQFWLIKYILKFLEEYERLFGKIDFSRITNAEVNFFLKSNLFTQLKWFIVGLLIIPIFYNMFFFFTKWSATLGQKLMSIYVVSTSGTKMKFYHVVARSITLVIPWILSFFVVLNQYLVNHNIGNSLSDSSFIIFMIVFLSWYDLAFLTKNKLVFHDYITFTRVIENTKTNYVGKPSIFKKFFVINFVDEFKKFKSNIKNQIQKTKQLKEKYKKKKDNS